MYMSAFVCMYAYQGVCKSPDQKAFDPLEQELQTATSCHMDSGN